MKNESRIKPGTKLVEKNHILYELNSNGKVKKYNTWLGDRFAFLYDIIMKKSVLPVKLDSDPNLHDEILKQELSSLHSMNVLELGTGTGCAVQWLDKGNHYSGVDVSPGLLRRAVKRFDKAGYKDPRFYIANVEDMPFQDSCFDVCLCILTLNFFRDIDAVVKQVRRVLRKAGLFFGCVPVPERNRRNSTIQGVLHSQSELGEIFKRNGFKFESRPVSNGALFYFRATRL